MVTYDQVFAVISRPSSRRTDFEVLDLLPWFRKKSEIFKDLQQDLLVDLIKHSNFVTKERDDLIIKQGDVGHCMYIVLRGQVTIFMLYPKKGSEQTGPNAAAGENIRQQLGDFVCKLGPGETFGEIALQSETDSIRTASIIANEHTDLIEIDRDLYNSTVKEKMLRDFEDKVEFINRHPYFGAWVPRYRKQLAMALRKESYPYDSVLIRQADTVEDIHYILKGEVKITVDPDQHITQYPKIMAGIKRQPTKASLLKNNLMNGDSTSPREQQNHKSSHSRLRNKPPKKQLIEVSLLGSNEPIGDIEVLLDLTTSIQTAVCTQPSEILILEMKHYERILARRNSKTIDQLRIGLLPRLNLHSEQLSLMESLANQVRQRARLSQVIQNPLDIPVAQSSSERTSKQPRTQAQLFESFIPPPGPLIDMYGPGTVFHRIRQRERTRMMKARGGARGVGGGMGLNRSLDVASVPQPIARSNGQELLDPTNSKLEGRLRNFLQGGGQNVPRVAPLHKVNSEDPNLVPGVAVLIRPRSSVLPSQGSASMGMRTEDYTMSRDVVPRPPIKSAHLSP